MFIFFLVFFVSSCITDNDDNTNNNNQTINVTEPNSTTIWYHEAGIQKAIMWTNATGSQIRALIYKNEEYLDIAHDWTANDGEAYFSWDISAWGTGSDYKIKVEDNNDNFGWSNEFTILEEYFFIFSPIRKMVIIR